MPAYYRKAEDLKHRSSFEAYQVAYSVVSLTAKEGNRYAMMTLDWIREKKAFLIDMDGVIYHAENFSCRGFGISAVGRWQRCQRR